jgi:O-antigen/teichoic acid export membrane protein
LVLLGGLLVPGLIVAPGLLTLLYGDVDGIAAAPGLFRILLLALPFTYLMLLNGHVLYALGKQRQVSTWMVLATVVNGLLNAWLIPRWGMGAAAWVTLSSEIVLFLALRLAAHRALHGVRDLNLEGAPS